MNNELRTVTMTLAVAVLAASAVNAQPNQSAAAQARSNGVVPLKADVQITYTLADGRVISNQSHIYRSRSGQVREDSGLGAVITDVGQGTVTLLVAQTKEARVVHVPQNMQAVRSAKPLVPQVFDHGSHNGQRVTKARVTGVNGEKQELWTSEELGVVTWSRVEVPGMTTTRELQNISTDDPDPGLFQVPSDFTIVDDTIPANLSGSKDRPGLARIPPGLEPRGPVQRAPLPVNEPR
jgi:hypothetical protein